MNKLTRKGVLAEITEKIGKPLVTMSQPNYWRYEDRGRAAGYRRSLDKARDAYRAIRRGDDVAVVLDDLMKIGGIEANAARLIKIAYTTGFSETTSWQVVDDKITFIE